MALKRPYWHRSGLPYVRTCRSNTSALCFWQVMGAAGWLAPRELPRQQCSTLSHFGRARGKEAGANDETCLERRRSLSRTYELMRLRTTTCLDSWVRRMAQITGRQPGAAHRPLARGMKRPSSTALRQGRSPPEYTLGKRMTGSLRPSNGRRERMEHQRPKHKPEPKHPAPSEAPRARHPPRRPAGQTPAVEHRLHQADKQLVRALPQTRMATQQPPPPPPFQQQPPASGPSQHAP